jgi:hypothetical protein
MSGPLILLLIVLGLVALWACIKIAGRSKTATDQPASPAPVPEPADGQVADNAAAAVPWAGVGLMERLVERALDARMESLTPTNMSIDEAAQALWPLNARFRARMEQVEPLPYDKSLEGAADAAVERLVLDDSDWSGEPPGVWRVLWERQSQALTLLVLKAEDAGGDWDAPFVPVPVSAPPLLRAKLAIAFLLYARPLPFPIAERSGAAPGAGDGQGDMSAPPAHDLFESVFWRVCLADFPGRRADLDFVLAVGKLAAERGNDKWVDVGGQKYTLNGVCAEFLEQAGPWARYDAYLRDNQLPDPRVPVFDEHGKQVTLPNYKQAGELLAQRIVKAYVSEQQRLSYFYEGCVNWRFIAIHDEQTPAQCLEAHGTEAHCASEFWKARQIPCERLNCRCRFAAVAAPKSGLQH